MIEENMLRGSLVSSNEAKGGLGFKGERGYSAYEIAVQNGYEGTEQEWIDHFGLDLTDYIKTSDLLDLVYPVGSIYISVSNANPSTLFGGTWVQIKDTFLLSAGDTYTAGNTGGSATHTLTTNELPSHYHNFYKTGRIMYWDSSADPIGIKQGTGEDIAAQFSWDSKTANVGGGQAHNNMPPYLVVYVWKRTE